MESILVLTHVDEAGSTLTKASLESVSRRPGADRARPRRRLPSASSASMRKPRRTPSQLRPLACSPSPAKPSPSSLRYRCRRLRSSLPRGGCHHRPRAGECPLCTRRCRSGRPSWRLIDTHVTALVDRGAIEATRWFYRQRIEAVISRDARPVVPARSTLAPTRPFAGVPGVAQIEAIAVTLPDHSHQRRRLPFAHARHSNHPPRRAVLFVAGAGWTKKQPDGQIHVAEAGEQILSFLRLSGAPWEAANHWRTRKPKAAVATINPSCRSLPISIRSARPGLRRAMPRASLPAAMAKSPTQSAGVSSQNAAPSVSMQTAAGRVARPTSSTSPMRFR